MYGVGVYEEYDEDDEDDDVKRADSELKKKGVKLPNVKHKEVSVKKTAKDKEEEQLDELSYDTLKSYADKRGDQYFVQKKPAGFKELDNYDLGLKKLKKKRKEAEAEGEAEVNEGSGPYQLSDPKHPKFKANYEKFKKANPDKKLSDFVAAMAKKEKSGGLDEAAKPDFLDLDKDSNKKEPMKKAAKEKNIKSEDLSEGRGIDNFTPADIKELETMSDLDAMKARAAELIQTPSKKPIKPEKVHYYLRQLENMSRPVEVISLMYNMLLGGEGHGVIGSKHSMGQSGYHKRFGEEVESINESAELDAIKSLTKRLLG